MTVSKQLEAKAETRGAHLSASVSDRQTAAISTSALPCWCGNKSWSVCFRTVKSGLLRCSACGTCQTDPPPLRGADESSHFYTDYYSKVEVAAERVSEKSTRNAWFWKIAQQVPSLSEVRHSVVDIGSGDGHFCAELRGAGWPDVTGIEISSTRVARARRLYPSIPFYDCPIEGTDIAQQSLDLMVMDSVIEHLPDPLEMARGLWKYLKPGGTIVLLTPNMNSGHFRFLGRRWTGMLAPHAHIFLFTGPALSQLLVQAGFTVSHVGSLHMPVYSPFAYARRLFSGDVKGTLWRAHQEVGGLYGRAIGSGPMLYVVARRP